MVDVASCGMSSTNIDGGASDCCSIASGDADESNDVGGVSLVGVVGVSLGGVVGVGVSTDVGRVSCVDVVIGEGNDVWCDGGFGGGRVGTIITCTGAGLFISGVGATVDWAVICGVDGSNG